MKCAKAMKGAAIECVLAHTNLTLVHSLNPFCF